MSGPRVYAKMADDGLFPRWFRFEQRPPTVAIWFQAILAITVVCITTLKDLLGYLGLTLSICSALTISMLFVMRYRKQIDRLPGWGIPAGIYVIATLVLAVLYAFERPLQTVAVVATICVGVAVYPRIGKPLRPDHHA